MKVREKEKSREMKMQCEQHRASPFHENSVFSSSNSKCVEMPKVLSLMFE